MTLETKQGNPDRKRLVTCPYCGTEIKNGSFLRQHLPCEGVKE